jgi:hypothetical protein
MPVNNFAQSNSPKNNLLDKKYVDSKFITITRNLDSKMNISGGKLTGNLDLGNNKIINVKLPEESKDVVVKDYCDNNIERVKLEMDSRISSLDNRDVTKSLDMNWNTINNLKFPMTSLDAINKEYLLAATQRESIGIEYLLEISEVIYNIVLNNNDMNSLREYVEQFIFIYTRISLITENYFKLNIGNGITLMLQRHMGMNDLKINFIKLIEVVPKQVFEAIKMQLARKNLISAATLGPLNIHFRTVINLSHSKKNPEGSDVHLKLLVDKNILLLSLGLLWIMGEVFEKLFIE